MTRSIVTLVLLLLPLGVRADDKDRYWVLFRNGEELIGHDLRNLYTPDKNATLNGRRLFDPNNPALLLHDQQQASEPARTYVQFTNGDILLGQPRRFERAADDIPESLVVSLFPEYRSMSTQPTELRVRPDMVKRIVLESDSAARYESGMIVTRDGRRQLVRSVRWLGESIRVLAEDGTIQSYGLASLAELHFPERDTVAAATIDLAWNALANIDRLDCLQTVHGARFTIPRRMFTDDLPTDPDRKWNAAIAIQPIWALDAIRLEQQTIVSHAYRDVGQVPLELLPVTAVNEQHATHHWSWKRNQSVIGGPLYSGSIRTDQGLGVHAHAELTFQLPPGAQEFFTYVGLDRSVAEGGCVQCRVSKDLAGGHTFWQSGHLRGAQSTTRAGPFNIAGTTQLVLTADMAHQGRPGGTDPLDIRDHVDWLLPMVKIDAAALPRLPADLAVWFPRLAGWEVAPETLPRLAVQPVWDKTNGRWRRALIADANKPGKQLQPVELFREMKVTLQNAWLSLEAARDAGQDGKYEISVRVNGEPLASTMNGNLVTQAYAGKFNARVWHLAPFLDQTVKVSLDVEPQENRSPAGILWGTAQPQPLITGLNGRSGPILPAIPLTSLTPIQPVTGEIKAGQLTNGEPLVVYGNPFDAGLGIPTNSEISYQLDPAWTRFVAVIGLCGGWQGAGPYKILLDGKLHWQSSSPEKFARNQQAQQIDIPLPSGHKTITIRVEGTDSYGALAVSGFLKESS